MAINTMAFSYRLHGATQASRTFMDFVEEDCDCQLSFAQQEAIINSLSNDSCPSGKSGVSRFSFFSTGTCVDMETVSKYLPTSVRNRVLYRYRLEQNDTMLQAVYVHNPTKRKASVQRPPQGDNANKAARTQTHASPSEPPPLDFHPPSPSPSSSPYMKFVCNMVENGTLLWRIHRPQLDVIAMNDISLEGEGRFLSNKFVHVWRRSSDQGISYFCKCNMHDILMRSQHQSNADHACVHVRFFQENIEPRYSSLFTEDFMGDTPIDRKLQHALQYLNVAVVRLDSDSLYHRFSVMSEESVAVVRLQHNRVSCLNGECRSHIGHTRKLRYIDDPCSCPHITALCANKEVWASLVPLLLTSPDDESSEPEDGDADNADDIGPTLESPGDADDMGPTLESPGPTNQVHWCMHCIDQQATQNVDTHLNSIL